MERVIDYFDQVIIKRFLALAIEKNHNINDFMDKEINKSIDKELEIKEYNEHGFHKYVEEKIDIKKDTYFKLNKLAKKHNVKVRDIIQTIMEETIWDRYLEDIGVPDISFERKEIEDEKIEIEIGKKYDFKKNNALALSMANVSEYESIEVVMISKKFPDRYIDKDKNIKLIQKQIFRDLTDFEVNRRKNDTWVLVEISKTNDENILLWLQKEQFENVIKEA